MRIYIKINTAVNAKINPMFIFVEIIQVCGNHVCLLKSCLFVEIMQIVEIMSVCGNHASSTQNRVELILGC